MGGDDAGVASDSSEESGSPPPSPPPGSTSSLILQITGVVLFLVLAFAAISQGSPLLVIAGLFSALVFSIVLFALARIMDSTDATWLRLHRLEEELKKLSDRSK